MIRRILRFSLCLLAILLFIAACLPPILSTKKGQQFLSNRLSRALDTKVELADLQLSWFSSQTVRSLDVKKEGAYHFHFDSFHAAAPLWKFILPGCHWDLLLLENPSFEYELPASSGPTPPSVAHTSSPTDLSDLFKHKVHLEVTGAKVSCHSPQGVCELEQLSLKAELNGLHAPSKLLLAGYTNQQGQQGAISIDLHIDDPKHVFESINASLKLEQFPLDVIYPWMPPPYVQLLEHWDHQATVDLAVTAKREGRQGNYKLEFKAKPLEAHLEMMESSGQISLVNPATLSLALSPKETQLLMGPTSNLPQVSSRIDAKLQLSTLDFDTANPEELEFDMELQLKELQLARHAQAASLGPFRTTVKRHGSTQIEINGLNPKLPCHCSIKLEGAPQALALTSLACEIDKLQGSDLEVWATLPSMDIGWAFPLAVSLKADEQGEGYSVNTVLKSPLAKLQLEGSFQGGDVIVQQLEAQLPPLNQGDLFIDAAHLQASHISCQMSDPVATLNGELALRSHAVHYQKLRWAPISCSIKAQAGTIDCLLNSTSLNASASVSAKKGQIKLQKPLQLSIKLTPKEIASLFGKVPFIKPLQLQLVADPFEWDTKAPLADLMIKLHGKVEGLVVAAPGPSKINLPDLLCQVSCSGDLNRISTDIETTSSPAEVGGAATSGVAGAKLALHAVCTAKQLESAILKMSKVPSTWLDLVTGNDAWASTLFGPQIDTTAQVHIDSQLASIDLDVTTNQLHALASLKQLAAGGWKLDKPASIQWTLTPDGYQTLQGWFQPKGENTSISLKDPLQLKVKLDSLEILSLQRPLSSTQAKATLSLDSLSLFNKITSGLSQLKKAEFELAYDKGELFAVKANGLTACESVDTSRKKQRQEGKVDLSLKLKDFISLVSGVEQITAEKASVDIDLNAQSLGSDLLALACASRPQIAQLMGPLWGPKLDIQMKTQLTHLTGPISLDITSQFTQASIKGKLDKGIVNLTQPLKTQLQVTKELSTVLLDSNQSAITGFFSESPITLEISDKQFAFPLMPFSRDKIHVDNIHVELGKVQCANKGALSVALSLLTSKQSDKDKNLHLWFNPIDLSMKEGIFNLQRVDLLAADAFPLIAWGSINFPKDRVDMQLAITRDAFISAFGMDELPDDYLMLMPIQGTLATASIDKTKATTKITALLAWHAKSAVNVLSFTPAGLLADQVIKAVVTHRDSTPIPVSRYPIPWKIKTKKSVSSNLLQTLDSASQNSASPESASRD